MLILNGLNTNLKIIPRAELCENFCRRFNTRQCPNKTLYIDEHLSILEEINSPSTFAYQQGTHFVCVEFLRDKNDSD